MSMNEDQPGLLSLIRRDRFSREIVLVLLIKLVLIFAIWWLFFDVPDEQRVTHDDVTQQIIGASTLQQAVTSDD